MSLFRAFETEGNRTRTFTAFAVICKVLQNHVLFDRHLVPLVVEYTLYDRDVHTAADLALADTENCAVIQWLLKTNNRVHVYRSIRTFCVKGHFKTVEIILDSIDCDNTPRSILRWLEEAWIASESTQLARMRRLLLVKGGESLVYWMINSKDLNRHPEAFSFFKSACQNNLFREYMIPAIVENICAYYWGRHRSKITRCFDQKYPNWAIGTLVQAQTDDLAQRALENAVDGVGPH